jgi:hypothetical protein
MKLRFAILLVVALLFSVNGTQGENLGELAAEHAVSLVGRDIPYSQSTGSSHSKGWDINEGYLDADSDTIKGDGIDCSGLVVWAYNKAMERTIITDPIKTENPTLGADVDQIAAKMTNFLITKQQPSESDLRRGDLIILRNPNHVAIYVGDGYVVHSSPQNAELNNLLAKEIKGSQGTIVDGPIEKDDETWWKIEYMDGVVGWSAQKDLVSMGTSEDVLAAVAAVTIGSFGKGDLIQVASDEGANVKSTPELYATGVTMLSLENWLNLPIDDVTKYKDCIYGYGGPDSINIEAQFFQESSFSVPAIADWIDTGIQVSEGDSIAFTATGQATYGHEGSPDSYPTTNPDGDRFVNDISIGGKIDPYAINPTAPIGSLVGKVGLNGDCFYLGSSNQLIMPSSGALMLRYNDVEGGYYNNGGSYEVAISRKEGAIAPESLIDAVSVASEQSHEAVLSPGWDIFNGPISSGSVIWQIVGDTLQVKFQLNGADPNHEYTLMATFFDPDDRTKLPDLNQIPGWIEYGTSVAPRFNCFRDGITASGPGELTFGHLNTDSNGDGVSQFEFILPPGTYYTQFTIRRGECWPGKGDYSGCGVVYRTGNKYGDGFEMLVVT